MRRPLARRNPNRALMMRAGYQAAYPLMAHVASQGIKRYFKSTGSGRGGVKRRKVTKSKKPFKATVRPRSGRFPSYRVGRQMGVYGKPGPRVGQLATVRRTLDKTVTSTQQDVNYVGFMAYGTPDEVITTFCMQIWKDIFQRAGTPLSSWQGRVRNEAHVTSPYSNRLASVTFFFQRDEGSDVNRASHQVMLTTTDTAESLADALRTQIDLQYNAGYLPRSYALEDSAGTPFVTHETWGEDIVTWSAQCQAKIQNVTPTVGGVTDINDVNANPLQGRIYDFKHGYVKWNTDYLQMLEASDPIGWGGLKHFQTMNNGTDLLQTEKLRHTALYGNELPRAFQSPPRGAAVFSNLEGMKNMQMPPGGYQVIKRSVTCTASVRRFIIGAYTNKLPTYATGPVNVKPVTIPIVNKVIMVGLEPTVRSVTDEIVKVIVNRKIEHSISIRKKKPSNLPVAVDVADAVNIGALTPGQDPATGQPTTNPEPVYGDGEWLCPTGYTYNPTTHSCDPN